MSLKSDQENALATMQSKELDLHAVKSGNNRWSRYDQMDKDEKSMLKSAITKLTSQKEYQKIPGETLDQLQERIIEDVYA